MKRIIASALLEEPTAAELFADVTLVVTLVDPADADVVVVDPNELTGVVGDPVCTTNGVVVDPAGPVVELGFIGFSVVVTVDSVCTVVLDSPSIFA